MPKEYTYKCSDCGQTWNSEYNDEDYCSACGSNRIRIVDEEDRL